MNYKNPTQDTSTQHRKLHLAKVKELFGGGLDEREVALLNNRVIEENMALSQALHKAQEDIARLERHNDAIVKRFGEQQLEVRK